MVFKRTYTFDDVCLVPVFSNVPSRSTPSLATAISSHIKSQIPFIPANMDSVISVDLAKVLVSHGGIPIFHRFCGVREQEEFVTKFPGQCVISFGLDVKIDQLKRFQDLGALGGCLDVAHAHASSVLRLVAKIKSEIKCNFDLIVGNIATSSAYIDLCNSGADACKVGIGSGSICSTRLVTGFGQGQLSAILECAEQARKYKIPIISDGGIKGPADVAKALAAGASSVMMGKVFGLTFEGASLKVTRDGVLYGKVRGQASLDFQDEKRGGLKPGTVPEGEAFFAKVESSTAEVLEYYSGSLRSALTYGGSKNILELQTKAEFREVLSGYSLESGVRGG